jgi:hypothetical protein
MTRGERAESTKECKNIIRYAVDGKHLNINTYVWIGDGDKFTDIDIYKRSKASNNLWYLLTLSQTGTAFMVKSSQQKILIPYRKEITFDVASVNDFEKLGNYIEYAYNRCDIND